MAGPARPGWGWHRLHRSWAQRIVGRAPVAPGELVLDVGAGHGALTQALVEAGARVVAFELHPARARLLRARFAGLPVRVVQADVADLRLPRRPFRVVANPPFAVVDEILGRLVAPGSRLVSADVIVPRHVARRWARAGARGAGRWASTFSVSIGPVVPSWAFGPPSPRHAQMLIVRRRIGDRRSGASTGSSAGGGTHGAPR